VTSNPEQARERTLLVHQHRGGAEERECPEEFRLLAESAGAEVCACLTAYRPAPDPSTFIGRGKLQELKEAVHTHCAELVIINHAITPVQERNLTRALGCRVLDRTGLILDIFAQRAASAEGKLQVELAQLRHLSTRLVRGWTHLERQKGGIGLRGPGETQLETDRRLVAQRIRTLKKRLEHVAAQRELRRKARQRTPIATVCLVGYTNAGKSSLFNLITGAGVLAEDRLFATLDPTMRRVKLPERGEIVLSDTVGFIRDLPHTLVQAFYSTLEEVRQAALLLNVVDISDPERRSQIEQVEQVLSEIGASDIPMITVYNKIDREDIEPHFERDARGQVSKIWMSAQTGAGLELLMSALADRLADSVFSYIIQVPMHAARIRAYLHQHGEVRSETVHDGSWELEVELGDSAFGRLRQLPEFGSITLQPSAAPQVVGAN